MMPNNPLDEKEKISLALKISLQKEQALATKYVDLAQSITDPSIQKQLQGLEQTSRHHLQLINQQMQQQNIM